MRPRILPQYIFIYENSLLNWSVCAIEIIYTGSLMTTNYRITVFLAVVHMFICQFQAQASDIRNGTMSGRQYVSGSEFVVSDDGDGLPGRERPYGLGCGSAKPACGLLHPTTLSYHPEIYNYRHYYNIVGHDANFSMPRYRLPMPAADVPEEILTPVPESGEKSFQAPGSARRLLGNQKKLWK
jgi:hypothetical protein